MFYRLLASIVSILPVNTSYNSYYLVKPIETRVKIAIIDTGIEDREDIKQFLCKDEHFDFTNTGITDTMKHGTNLAYLMSATLDPNKHCMTVIKLFKNWGSGTESGKPAMAIEKAISVNAKFINLSWGGEDFIESEKKAIQKAIDNKIYVIVAAGNNGRQLKTDIKYYPACYDILSPYFRIVGNGKNPQERNYTSNYGPIVTDWADGINACGAGYCMNGSSQSTALITAKLVGKLFK